MTIYSRDLARKMIDADTVSIDGVSYDVSNLDYYSILRVITEDLGHGETQNLLEMVIEDSMVEIQEEALTMNDMVAKDPTIASEWDDFDAMLAQQDLGDIDPSSYQPDDGDSKCEGGGCTI